MGLKAAMGVSLVALFGLFYALIFVFSVWFFSGTFLLIFLVIMTSAIVFLQYLIGPLIVRWIYRIDWLPYDQYESQFPHLAEVVNKVCELRGVKLPKMGIVHDLNPNAFTFGWTKNSARVVITDGILKHLNKKEQEAVVAHEMGHVVHSDFILMTVVFAIPLLLLTVARWAYYASFYDRRSSRDDEGSAIYLIVIAVISYAVYYLGYLISLIISRIREYYADEHAAEVLQNPNALSTGLVKIAYGLVAEGNYGKSKEQKKSKVRGAKGLGIFDPSSAPNVAMQSVGGEGKFSKDAIQAAAAWDLFNPWAKYYQIMSTHPLPAKRIQRLNDQCAIYGIKPEIDLSRARKIKEEQAGKSMADEFLYDLTIKTLPSIILGICFVLTAIWIFGVFGLIAIDLTVWTFPTLILFWGGGLMLVGIAMLIRNAFMYKKNFKENRVVDLVTDVKVSPIRCRAAIIKGRIIGRGIPGYYFGEDLYFQDATGLLYVDYRFGIGIVDFFWGAFKAKRLVGEDVKIIGWYRRGPSPYIQVSRIETASGKIYKNHAQGMDRFFAFVVLVIGMLIVFFAMIWPVIIGT